MNSFWNNFVKIAKEYHTMKEDRFSEKLVPKDIYTTTMKSNLNFSFCKRQIILFTVCLEIETTCTVNSRFMNVHFSFLKSRVVWFEKDLCSEFKNRSSEKNALFRWIRNLRSFLNREFTVLSKNIHTFLHLSKTSFLKYF